MRATRVWRAVCFLGCHGRIAESRRHHDERIQLAHLAASALLVLGFFGARSRLGATRNIAASAGSRFRINLERHALDAPAASQKRAQHGPTHSPTQRRCGRHLARERQRSRSRSDGRRADGIDRRCPLYPHCVTRERRAQPRIHGIGDCRTPCRPAIAGVSLGSVTHETRTGRARPADSRIRVGTRRHSAPDGRTEA